MIRGRHDLFWLVTLFALVGKIQEIPRPQSHQLSPRPCCPSSDAKNVLTKFVGSSLVRPAERPSLSYFIDAFPDDAEQKHRRSLRFEEDHARVGLSDSSRGPGHAFRNIDNYKAMVVVLILIRIQPEDTQWQERSSAACTMVLADPVGGARRYPV